MTEWMIFLYRRLRSRGKPVILDARAQYLYWLDFKKQLERPETIGESLLFDAIMRRVDKRIKELELLVDIGVDVMGFIPIEH